MTKPAGVTFAAKQDAPKHFVGNLLMPPDVLDGSLSPAIKAIYYEIQGLI